MRPNNTLKIIFIAACFVMLATAASSVMVDKIVAVVNDEVITQSEVIRLLMPIFEQYKEEYTGKRLENKMIEAEDAVMEQLIEDKLILSEAKRQGMEATDREIETRLRTIKNRFGTEEQFREGLARQNASLSELRNRIRDEIIKSKVMRQELGWKVVITPSEIRGYYDNHKEDFAEPAKVRLQTILIRKENSARARDEAKFLINLIRKFIDEGRDFGGLAKEYSEGANAKNSGDLGLVEKGEMRKEIDEVIFFLEAGEASGIIETPIGYHIFKVTEKIPEKVTDFEVVKYEIEDLIYKQKMDKGLKKWLRGLRKNAYISIK
jgi:peptidyl-prolyl cis-trans isomerase SurA